MGSKSLRLLPSSKNILACQRSPPSGRNDLRSVLPRSVAGRSLWEARPRHSTLADLEHSSWGRGRLGWPIFRAATLPS